MEVFISWSGKRSKALAIILSKWLRFVNHYIKPWMSDIDLRKGDRWLTVIGEKLSNYSVGIIVVTPENMESPWLLFEAGALSKAIGKSKVCPLLLGMQASDLNGPLSQFQATTFNKEEIYKLVLSLNDTLNDKKLDELILKETFEKFWPDLEKEVEDVIRIGISSRNLKYVVDALQKKGFQQPSIGRMVCFNEGFESHQIYETALAEAHKRLYIFGRKNRKLFDKEHWGQLEKLREKVANGLDFRCMFLSPKSSSHIISEEHGDSDFIDQLKQCTDNAYNVLKKFDFDPDKICKAYHTHRQHAIIVIDNAVMFAPIERDINGKAKRLTKCSFEVIDADSPLGKELIEQLISTWKNSTVLSKVLDQ